MYSCCLTHIQIDAEFTQTNYTPVPSALVHEGFYSVVEVEGRRRGEGKREKGRGEKLFMSFTGISASGRHYHPRRKDTASLLSRITCHFNWPFSWWGMFLKYLVFTHIFFIIIILNDKSFEGPVST
jgi:hypothetical protein